jgi:hypothetical protein
VYDMYPWNETDSGASQDQDQNAAARVPAPRNGTTPRSGARDANSGDVPADFTQAVQVALDRRDNGGDAVPAAPPAPQPAPPPATRPRSA